MTLGITPARRRPRAAMQNGGQLIPSRPCAQHCREIDRVILTDVEIEIAENVVEMIAHEPRRALGFAVPGRAHEGDMFIMTTGRRVTTSVEGDHQRRSRDQASQEGGKNAFSGRRRDGDVKGSG
jgi:hypothetical protein